jgi:hypothetical protein
MRPRDEIQDIDLEYVAHRPTKQKPHDVLRLTRSIMGPNRPPTTKDQVVKPNQFRAQQFELSMVSSALSSWIEKHRN